MPRIHQEWLQCICMFFRFNMFLSLTKMALELDIGINSGKKHILIDQTMAIKLAFFNRNLQHLLNKWTCEACSLSLSIHAAGKGWRKINLCGFKDWTEMIYRLTWNQYDDDPMD